MNSGFCFRASRLTPDFSTIALTSGSLSIACSCFCRLCGVSSAISAATSCFTCSAPGLRMPMTSALVTSDMESMAAPLAFVEPATLFTTGLPLNSPMMAFSMNQPFSYSPSVLRYTMPPSSVSSLDATARKTAPLGISVEVTRSANLEADTRNRIFVRALYVAGAAGGFSGPARFTKGWSRLSSVSFTAALKMSFSSGSTGAPELFASEADETCSSTENPFAALRNNSPLSAAGARSGNLAGAQAALGLREEMQSSAANRAPAGSSRVRTCGAAMALAAATGGVRAGGAPGSGKNA
mmetsp:Transcript_74956/g.223344  ORF Transcript_74956/g.223344 Transcript_74956/m.223344 type:complete len:296 (+) Transcript_74956:271-1158(+)